MLENNLKDILNKLDILFTNKIFISNLKDARNNWLGIEVDEVLKKIYNFLANIETILI